MWATVAKLRQLVRRLFVGGLIDGFVSQEFVFRVLLMNEGRISSFVTFISFFLWSFDAPTADFSSRIRRFIVKSVQLL